MSNLDTSQIDAFARRAVELGEAERGEFINVVSADDLHWRHAILARIEELERGGDQQPDATLHDSIREELSQRASPPLTSIEAENSDIDRLYGLLCVQLGYIEIDGLMQASQSVASGESKDVAAALLRSRLITDEEDRMLRQVLTRQLEKSKGDAAERLKTLQSASAHATEVFQPTQSEIERERANASGSNTGRLRGQWANERFRILRPHRQGGLGKVSIARDEELNRDVALKEVRSEISRNSSARQRLQIEAEITGRLEHPGIVPVYGLGAFQDGSPYYCMRFVQGDSLDDAIREFHQSKDSMRPSERNMAIRNLIRRLIDVCDAIAYAHSRQVLHRDLKPGNIMLGRYGETLVVDWGLAKALGTEETVGTQPPVIPRSGSTAAPTQDGSTIGTPEYMSPEQARGDVDGLDDTTDVYSLGATLFALLTGRPPLHGSDKAQIRSDVILGRIPTPRTIDSSIHLQLDAICAKAMQLEKAERYPAVMALADDLERWLADEPVSAMRDSFLQRAGRVLRKRRSAALGLAGTTLAALVGLTAAYTISAYKNGVITLQRDQLAAQRDSLELQRDSLELQRNQLALQGEKLESQNADLEQSASELQGNYDSLQELTERFIDKAEKEFSQDPAMSSVRNWLTSEVVQFVEDFDRQHPDNRLFRRNPSSMAWLGRLYRFHGNNLKKQGETEQGLAFNVKAVALLEQTVKDQPASVAAVVLPQALRDLANTLSSIGRFDESLVRVRRAIESTDEALNNPSFSKAVDVIKRIQAGNLVDYASTEYTLDNFSTALEAAQKAEAFLLDNRPDATADMLLLFALNRQAACFRELGDLQQAREKIDLAKAAAGQAKGDHSSRMHRNLDARIALEDFRLLATQSEDPGSVQVPLDLAITIWEELSAEHPEFLSYSLNLNRARISKAGLLRSAGRMREARALAETAVQELEGLVVQETSNVSHLEAAGDAHLELAALANAAGESSLEHSSTSKAIDYFERSSGLAGIGRVRVKIQQARKSLAEMP